MSKLKTTSVKVDPDKIKKLEAKGIPFSDLVRIALDEALKVCPTCKQPIKK